MLPTFDEFTEQALARGFDEVLERVWPANAVVPDHDHDFAVDALLVEGEMWLRIGNQTQHLLPGDRFALERKLLHAERYGPAGATYWVARRN